MKKSEIREHTLVFFRPSYMVVRVPQITLITKVFLLNLLWFLMIVNDQLLTSFAELGSSKKMTLTMKTRLAKRKLEIREVIKEKQKDTSKKHDRDCLQFSEISTKEALLKHLRVLEEKVVQLNELNL